MYRKNIRKYVLCQKASYIHNVLLIIVMCLSRSLFSIVGQKYMCTVCNVSSINPPPQIIGYSSTTHIINEGIYLSLYNWPPFHPIILIIGRWCSVPVAEARGALGSVPSGIR